MWHSSDNCDVSSPLRRWYCLRQPGFRKAAHSGWAAEASQSWKSPGATFCSDDEDAKYTGGRLLTRLYALPSHFSVSTQLFVHIALSEAVRLDSST
jgi:hypothetical protein